MKKFAIPALILGLVLIIAMFWGQKTKQQASIDQTQPATQTTTGETKLPIECSGKALPGLTEGPYYKAGSPERQIIIEQNTPQTSLTLEGYVLDTNCQPIAGAWLDFWQADGNGVYDNTGYNLRGHQYTDENGKYKLITVVPGLYPGRTEHIHFKVKATEASPTITSQLFLPNSNNSSSDSIFNEALVVNLTDDKSANDKYATYNFVVDR